MASEQISKILYDELSPIVQQVLEKTIKERVTLFIDDLCHHLIKKGVKREDLDKYIGDYIRTSTFVEENGRVVIVLDYSDSNHAIFNPLPADFVTLTMKTDPIFRHNEKLSYGEGWLMKKKGGMDIAEFKKRLQESSIPFDEMTLSEFQDRFNKKVSTGDTKKKKIPVVDYVFNEESVKVHEETGYIIENLISIDTTIPTRNPVTTKRNPHSIGIWSARSAMSVMSPRIHGARRAMMTSVRSRANHR
mgnify:CR=1 FL=1